MSSIFTSVVVTFIAGYLGTATLGNLLNLPDAGAVVAICVMGIFIMSKIQQSRKEA